MHHEQALPTQQLANPAISWHFGCRRLLRFNSSTQKETAKPPLPYRVVLKCCGNELSERVLPNKLSLFAQGSVWVESSESP